jgi:hypothetical protein
MKTHLKKCWASHKEAQNGTNEETKFTLHALLRRREARGWKQIVVYGCFSKHHGAAVTRVANQVCHR